MGFNSGFKGLILRRRGDTQKTIYHIDINFGAHFKVTDILSNFSGHYTAASSDLVSARKSETTKLSTGKEQERPCTYKRNNETRSPNHSYWGKFVFKYSECVSVGSVIQHAMRMRRTILTSVTVWLYHTFPHYLINGKNLKKTFLNIKCVFFNF